MKADGLPLRKCPHCGADFKPVRAWQKFCTTAHQKAYHNNQTQMARDAWKAQKEQEIAQGK